MSDGPLAALMRGHFGASRVPVPSGHAPRLAAHGGAVDALKLHEPGDAEAWLDCDVTCDAEAWR